MAIIYDISDRNVQVVKDVQMLLGNDTVADTRLVKICCTFWLIFLPDSVGSTRIC